MMPEWLSIGIPRYTQWGGLGNSRNTFKWVSQLETAGISPREPQGAPGQDGRGAGQRYPVGAGPWADPAYPCSRRWRQSWPR